MADHWQILFASALIFMLIARVHSQINDDVPITLVDDAVQKGAVCSDGSPGVYHYAAGSGDGVNNWLVFLAGGGWCWKKDCKQRAGGRLGSTNNITTVKFGGLLSSNQEINPDFYNWNRVFVRYCDGSSFIGDTEVNDNGTRLQLRGSRIFSAVMDELLEKGMRNANNAILSGSSAGGVSTILHCDGFRALLPHASRVKCLSDGGFFIGGKDLPYADFLFAKTVEFHNLTNFLPTSCTSRMKSAFCLFPENLVGDIQTPIFLLNSAFDRYQIRYHLLPYPDPDSWRSCTSDTNNSCFRDTFLKKLKGVGDNPSRGLFINSCYLHGMMDLNDIWNTASYGLENKTIGQVFSNWHFDRAPIQLIDTEADYARNCTV